MVSRIINGIEIDVDEFEGNECYFDEAFSQKLSNYGLSDILYELYKINNSYIPLSAVVELTNKCNFNCPFCYIHTCKQKPIIDTESWINDFEYLISKGLLCVTLTGGECLLHPGFKRIYEYLKKKGVLVTVLSNLSLLDDETVELWSTYKPYKVDVSIYAIDETNMRKTTCQDQSMAKTVLKNIERLADLGINVTCKTPINKLTVNQIDGISKWCFDRSLVYFTSYEIYENYENVSMRRYGMSAEEIAHDHIAAKKSNENIDLREHGIKKNFICKGGQYGIFLSYERNMRPCMPFYSVKSGNFDIKDLGIDLALNRMVKFIESYSGTALEGCKGCDIFNLCQECIITQLKHREIHEYMEKKCKENRELYKDL